MNIKEILESKESIEKLTQLELPLNIAIKVSKVQKNLNSILDIYQDRRKALFEKYGEGDDLEITKENRDDFINDHDTLIEEELDIEIQKISVDALGDIKIAPNHITNLTWLLE